MTTEYQNAEQLAQLYFATVLTRHIEPRLATALAEELVSGLRSCDPPMLILRQDSVGSAVKAINGIKAALLSLE